LDPRDHRDPREPSARPAPRVLPALPDRREPWARKASQVLPVLPALRAPRAHLAPLQAATSSPTQNLSAHREPRSPSHVPAARSSEAAAAPMAPHCPCAAPTRRAPPRGSVTTRARAATSSSATPSAASSNLHTALAALLNRGRPPIPPHLRASRTQASTYKYRARPTRCTSYPTSYGQPRDKSSSSTRAPAASGTRPAHPAARSYPTH
jgi:hypothetical protein